MKVLIVFNHPAPYKVNLFNELSKDIDLDVIFERRKAKNRNDAFYKNNINFKVHYLNGLPIGNENFFSFSLKKFIKHNYSKYDRIIMNGYSTFSEMIALNYMIKHNIPYTLMVNGGVIKKDSHIKLCLKSKYISNASNYLSPNLESNKYLIYYGANENEIYLYPYSNIYEKDLISLNDIKTNNGVYISVGQFIPRKNNEQLIEIFNNLDEKLILIGDGPLKEKYKKLIMKDNISLFPYQDKESLFKIMRESKALITLSKEDIFGHTVIEALANGLPVISSNKVISGLQIIKKGYNGYIINLDNNTEILEAIHSINKINRADCVNSVSKFTIEESKKEILKALK